MFYTYRPYQQKTKEDAHNFLYNSSFKKGLGVKPVGTGKSLDSAIISNETDENCLVVQPSEELLRQNLEKAQNLGLDPTVFSASMKSRNISKLTYATPLSLVNYAESFKDFKIVVIDEAHVKMSNDLKKGRISSKSKFNEFLEFINPRKIIGLTATPLLLATTRAGSEQRMVNRTKKSYWNQAEVFHMTQIHEIKDEYWANLKYNVIGSSKKSLELNSTGNDFKMESIIHNYEENRTNAKVIEQYENLMTIGKKSMLTFVPSIKEGELLKKLNKDFELISDALKPKERLAIITDFKKGNIPNLINCETLTTGFDYPELDAIIMARNTNSFTLYYQMIGRVVRPIVMPDGSIFKKEGWVVDLTSNYERFGSIENITFEKQDYTKGWAMWNGDRIMTGFPFNDWDMPSRDEMIKLYNETKIEIVQEEIKFPFGKHKGKKIEEVFKYDKGYLSWILNNQDFDWSRNMKLKIELEKLFKKDILNN